jgi:hypothetical protein
LFKLPAAAFVRPADAFPAQFHGSNFPASNNIVLIASRPRTIMHKAAPCFGAALAAA